MTKQALEGIKVADFSWVATGPLSIKYLADHGATVVHVESHTRPDSIRVATPFKDGKPGIDHSGFFTDHNSSKYGMSLNLNKPKGREIAQRLVMWADVIAESYTPGAMAKWGLDYDNARRIKPDIIYLSVSIEGQNGPRAMLPGYGPISNAIAGIYQLSGWPDQGPAAPWGAYADYIAPRFAVASLMAALDHKRRTGEGQYIDLSQVESALQFLAPPILDCFVNGRVMNRDGNHLPYAAPHGVYPCMGSDRWCAIAVFSDMEWRSFSSTIGGPAWTEDPRFGGIVGRKENEEELDRLVGGWSINHTAEQVEALMQSAGIAASVLENTKDLFEDPQVRHYGFFRWLEHAVMGRHVYTSVGFRLPETPDSQFAAPALGQHTDYVCRNILGLTDDQVAELVVEGAITTEADLPSVKAIF